MRTIVAGCRDIFSTKEFKNARIVAKTHGIYIDTLVCGMAKGVDTMAYEWAKRVGIEVHKYPADWSLGKSAGYIRNAEMADNADALIAVWDGYSKGTKMMIDLATKKGLKVYVHRVERNCDEV